MPQYVSITLGILVIALIALGFSLKITHSDMQYGHVVQAHILSAEPTRAANIHKRMEDALDLTLSFQTPTGEAHQAQLRIWDSELRHLPHHPKQGETLTVLWNSDSDTLSRETDVPTSLWDGGARLFGPIAALALVAFGVAVFVWRKGGA